MADGRLCPHGVTIGRCTKIDMQCRDFRRACVNVRSTALFRRFISEAKRGPTLRLPGSGGAGGARARAHADAVVICMVGTEEHHARAARRGPLRVRRHPRPCPSARSRVEAYTHIQVRSRGGAGGTPPLTSLNLSVIGRKRSPLLVLACADSEPGSAACRTSSYSLLAP